MIPQEGGGEAMTKLDLARGIAEKTCLAPGKVREVVQLALDGIIEALADKGRLELRNFGIFKVKSRRAGLARNPQTGESVRVEASRKMAFRTGKALRERLNK
jgi:nucleoid DNA-binding protein